MGAKYTTQATSGYDSSPPSDDGSQTASNLITWAGIKSKLTTVLKTFAEAVNTALVNAFDYSVRSVTSSDNTVASDHMRCVEIASTVTTAITISLGDAATMTSVYRVFVKNSSALAQTLSRVTSGDTIDGYAGNVSIPPLSSLILQTNSAVSGYVTNSKFHYGLSLPRAHLAGLTLSTAGGSATMTMAAGQATDSTNLVMMTLASAIGKTTSAWAVGTGNGGLDTGAIANATWYHFYEIMRPDTGVVDALFSLSASAPTMPTNYTYKRRVGSGLTNGSAQWVLFKQLGDKFAWDLGVNDVAGLSNPGTAAVTRTLTVPTGVVVEAWFANLETDQSNNRYILWTSLDQTDTVPSATAFTLFPQLSSGNFTSSVEIYLKTNTSGQVRYRSSASGASDNTNVVTKGWIDRRGRDD